MGKIDGAQAAITRNGTLDQAARILGPRLALQYNNLDGTTNPDTQGGLALITGYIGRAVTGFQMRTTAAGPGMGPSGASASAKLKDAINKGVKPNSAGQHVDFLQIYEPDVLAPDMQPILCYGASLFVATPVPPTPASEASCR